MVETHLGVPLRPELYAFFHREYTNTIAATAKDSWILGKILVRAIGRKASSDGNGTILGIGTCLYK